MSIKRRNKTKNNLQIIWQQLDNASGELYNATDNIMDMVNLDERIKRQIEMIDISRIDCLKEEIEALIKEKEKINE